MGEACVIYLVRPQVLCGRGTYDVPHMAFCSLKSCTAEARMIYFKVPYMAFYLLWAEPVHGRGTYGVPVTRVIPLLC